jgi:hypothetical protein
MTNHKRVRLKGLQAASFQHPLDKEAIRTLSKLKGIDFIIRKIMESGVEWAFRFQKLSSAIRVSPRQFPAIHAIHAEACHILDIPPVELFIEEHPVLNAYTAGYTKPAIVVTSALIDLLNEDELIFVLGHELGHQKCGHTFYHFMAQNLAAVINGGTHPWLMFRIKEAAVWAEETMPSFLEPFQEVEASPKGLTKKLSHAKAYNNRGNARMAAGSNSHFEEEETRFSCTNKEHLFNLTREFLI